MAPHSSPARLLLLFPPSPRPPQRLDPSPATGSLPIPGVPFPRPAGVSRTGGVRGGVALGAVAVGAASVALPATGAPGAGADGWDLAAYSQRDSAAVTAPRAGVSAAGPAVVTSQVSTMPTTARTQNPGPGAGVRALRKASDRDQHDTQQRRENQQRRDAAAAGKAQPTTGEATAAKGGFARPVSGRVTSSYGSRSGGNHYGLDVAARIGTPIRAAAAGTVISAGPASGFGLWVRVRHSDGTITVYGHINKALVDVGQKVDAGEVIAEVGNRGQSTGPHLHFEAHSADSEKLDPGRWLDQRGVGF